MAALCGFNRIDIANYVGDSDVWSRKLLHKTCVSIEPLDMSHVAVALQCLPSEGGYWLKRIVVNFRTGNYRKAFIQQFGQLADYPAFRLAAQAEQNEVVSRQDGVDQLRDNGVVVANDPGKKFFPRAQFRDQVCTQLVFDRARTIPTIFQLPKRLCVFHEIQILTARERKYETEKGTMCGRSRFTAPHPLRDHST